MASEQPPGVGCLGPEAMLSEKGSLHADTRDEQLAVPEMGQGKGEDWEEDGSQA